jgi:hypothetical protein
LIAAVMPACARQVAVGIQAAVCAAIDCSHSTRVCAADGSRQRCALRLIAAVALACARQMVVCSGVVVCAATDCGRDACVCAAVDSRHPGGGVRCD